MEEKPKDIHQVLGNLRRRITELSKGDYSKTHRDELQYVAEHIESFAPIDISRNLHKIVTTLKNIPEEVFQSVSDDTNEIISEEMDSAGNILRVETIGSISDGESRRSLMRKEVNNYINGLEYFIKKYGSSEPKRNTIKYDKYLTRDGQQNLEDLRYALINNDYIETIKLADFLKVFSGKLQKKIKSPISWKSPKYEFVHFLDELFANQHMHGNKGEGRKDWDIIVECFLHKGIPIDKYAMKGNSKTPARHMLIDNILQNL